MKRSNSGLLHQKRKYAISLYKKGMGVMQIVRESGLSYPTVRNVIDLYIELGTDSIKPRARGRRTGSGRRLNQSQEQIVKNLIQSQQPAAFGLNYSDWSRAAVADLIKKEFDISITARGVGNYMARWDLGQKNKIAVAPPQTQNNSFNSFAWGPLLKRFGTQSQTQNGKTALLLKRDIISNVLKPGERLTFERLSGQYGVGNSPLREAMFQLIGEGLVLSEENKGFLVAPINTEEMLDISSLRAYLEARALSLSIQHGDEQWESQVISANYLLKKITWVGNVADESISKKTADLWEQRHRELHMALCSACRSPWLLYFIGILYEHLERYRRYFWDYDKRVKGADYEHEQIVTAALNRNSDKAIVLLYDHFKTQAELSLMSAKPNDLI